MKTKKIKEIEPYEWHTSAEFKRLNECIQVINDIREELDEHISETNREEALLWGRIVMLEKELEKQKKEQKKMETRIILDNYTEIKMLNNAVTLLAKELEKHCGRDSGHCKEQVD